MSEYLLGEDYEKEFRIVFGRNQRKDLLQEANSAKGLNEGEGLIQDYL